MEQEGAWKWLHSPRQMGYINWSPGQGPNDHGFIFGGSLEDCAMIRSDDNYRWHDGPCDGDIDSFHYSFICQYELISQPVSASSTSTSTSAPSSTPSTTTIKDDKETTAKSSAKGECPHCQGEIHPERCKAKVMNCPNDTEACILTFTETGIFAGCSNDIQLCYRNTHSNQHICGYRPIPFDHYTGSNCSYCCDISSHNCFNDLLNQIIYPEKKALG